jgi:hypothetical protein
LQEAHPEVTHVAEVLLEYPDAVTDDTGKNYKARACGAEIRGTWQGWIEFVPLGDGEALRSSRETTQPNRQDTMYWATGLTPVYLEGALRRALRPVMRRLVSFPDPPYFEEPAEAFAEPGSGAGAVLDPFSVYQKGEALLRRQLSALAGWHLVNIIRTYELSAADPAILGGRPPAQLVETIVSGVRSRV